ncbi:MAG: YitT family protein [Rhodocyclales bacterium]|nr:YitT family protein [Rhodocyclales bacterium]
MNSTSASTSASTAAPSLPPRQPHTLLEDIQALLVGCFFVALSVLVFRHSHLMPGGTAGLSFLGHYLGGWPIGAVLFVVSIPFYLFAYRALGLAFTVRTFVAVGVLSVYTEVLPAFISFGPLHPVAAAITAGLQAGVGILILIRHGASLGGLGVLALYLQKTRGWRAGTVQMAGDCLILLAGLLAMSPTQVALSVLAAGALNLVIGVNHRPGRYFGA